MEKQADPFSPPTSAITPHVYSSCIGGPLLLCSSSNNLPRCCRLPGRASDVRVLCGGKSPERRRRKDGKGSTAAAAATAAVSSLSYAVCVSSGCVVQ